MSATTKKLVQQVEAASERRHAAGNMRMRVVGKEEIVIIKDEELNTYGILRPGEEVFSFLYNMAKTAGMVLAPGETFAYTAVNGKQELQCWITCYMDVNGYARYAKDDADQKARRERIHGEGMEVAGLKKHGLDDEDIKKLRLSSRVGLMFPAVEWLESALRMQGGGEVIRNLLTCLFKGGGKFPEEDFRSVLDHVGFEAPEETGRDFTSVCYGVKTLLVDIGFGKPTGVPVSPEKTGEVVDPAEGGAELEIEIDGHPVGNGDDHFTTEAVEELVNA